MLGGVVAGGDVTGGEVTGGFVTGGVVRGDVGVGVLIRTLGCVVVVTPNGGMSDEMYPFPRRPCSSMKLARGHIAMFGGAKSIGGRGAVAASMNARQIRAG